LQGPTLIIVRSSTGDTFGGCASEAWACAGWIAAAGSFLFLIENPHGDAPTVFECKDSKRAIWGRPMWGPYFGGDLCISGAGPCSWTNFPSSYADTLGRGKQTFTATTGDQWGCACFTVEDYEVWAVS
jgi:hypothetical protein